MHRHVGIAIVGAPKCATTSLLRYLGQHPGLHAHAQAECGFFSNDEEYARGWDTAYGRYFPRDPGPPVQLVAKRALMLYDTTALTRLAQHNAHVVVSALLRNPVDRAYSAYRYARLRGWQPAESFEDAVAPELDKGPSEDADRHGPGGYLSTGVYIWHVRHLVERLPHASVRLFTSEEMEADAAAVCRELFTAASVDPGFRPRIEVRHNVAAQARSERVARMLASRTGAVGLVRRMVGDRLTDTARRVTPKLTDRPAPAEPIAPETRAELNRFFEPYNRELAAVLERPTGWN